MLAYKENTMNKLKDKSKNFIIPHEFKIHKLGTAQFIVNDSMSEASSQQWQTLCQKLLKSDVKSWLNGNDHLQSAIETVLDWRSEVDNNSFDKVRSLSIMHELEKWQSDLTSIMKKINGINSIHFFVLNGMQHMWVITENPEFDKILEYSNAYMNYLENNSDALCNFMVYGVGEVLLDHLPKDTKSFYVRG